MTEEQITERLREAARTLHAMPSDRPRGHRCQMPEVLLRRLEECVDLGDADFVAELTRLRRERIASWARVRKPSPEAVSRMDECLDWLYILQPRTRACVWLHAEQVPQRKAASLIGLSRGGYEWQLGHGLRQLRQGLERLAA